MERSRGIRTPSQRFDFFLRFLSFFDFLPFLSFFDFFSSFAFLPFLSSVTALFFASAGFLAFAFMASGRPGFALAWGLGFGGGGGGFLAMYSSPRTIISSAVR